MNAGSIVGYHQVMRTLKHYHMLKNLFELFALTVQTQKLCPGVLVPGCKPSHSRSHPSHLVKLSLPNISIIHTDDHFHILCIIGAFNAKLGEQRDALVLLITSKTLDHHNNFNCVVLLISSYHLCLNFNTHGNVSISSKGYYLDRMNV